MNETETRERLRAAFGESDYPLDLTHRVASRLSEPPRRAVGHPGLVGLVAALLAFAIVATLILVRLQSSPRLVIPATTPHATSTPVSPPQASLPQLDLDRTQLSTAGEQVTLFNLTATDSGRTVTLIGAYADHARTVVFFRSLPPAGSPNVAMYDDSGFLNGAGTSGQASFGDYFYTLEAGPRPGSDGVAHLTVELDGFMSFSPAGQKQVVGKWTFNFALKPQGSNALTLNPQLTSVGSWKFTVEAMEVTSTLIHFQAVIDGAAVEDITNSTVTLLDRSGNSVRSGGWSAGTTVPKSQIGSTPPRSTRVNITWARPQAAGDYVLQIVGGGGQYRGTLSVPAPVPQTGKKGVPVLPTVYPEAPEALNLSGAWTTAITTGRPSSCGTGTGPSGTVFAFATWFQFDQGWYLLVLSTDPRVVQYKGPGTYSVTAWIYAQGGYTEIFQGPAQLTVNADKRPGPDNGSVRGTLTWTGAAAQPFTVDISGNWTCTWSQELGPG